MEYIDDLISGFPEKKYKICVKFIDNILYIFILNDNEDHFTIVSWLMDEDIINTNSSLYNGINETFLSDDSIIINSIQFIISNELITNIKYLTDCEIKIISYMYNKYTILEYNFD